MKEAVKNLASSKDQFTEKRFNENVKRMFGVDPTVPRSPTEGFQYPGLKVVLMPYQAVFVEWSDGVMRLLPGAFHSDKPGLGKVSYPALRNVARG